MEITVFGKQVHEYQALAQQLYFQILDIVSTIEMLGLQTRSVNALIQLGLILPPGPPPPLPPDQPTPSQSPYQQPSQTPSSSQASIPINRLAIVVDNDGTVRFVDEDDLGPPADDDIFEHRIINSERQEKILEALRTIYRKPIGPLGSTDQWNEFEISIGKVTRETAEIVSDQDKLTSFVKESSLIGLTTSFGEAISQFYIRRLKKTFKDNGNAYGQLFNGRFEQLVNHLRRVSAAQAVEIARDINIPEEELLALLLVGPFTHHKSCYWRFADELQLESPDAGILTKRGLTAGAKAEKKGPYEVYFDFKEKYGSYPLIPGKSVTKEVWSEWQPKVLELLQPHFNLGWQLDQQIWGPSCLIYEKKKINPISEATGIAMLLYLLILLITLGLAFFVYALFNKNYIELKGVKVKLVMKQPRKKRKKSK